MIPPWIHGWPCDQLIRSRDEAARCHSNGRRSIRASERQITEGYPHLDRPTVRRPRHGSIPDRIPRVADRSRPLGIIDDQGLSFGTCRGHPEPVPTFIVVECVQMQVERVVSTPDVALKGVHADERRIGLIHDGRGVQVFFVVRDPNLCLLARLRLEYRTDHSQRQRLDTTPLFVSDASIHNRLGGQHGQSGNGRQAGRVISRLRFRIQVKDTEDDGQIQDAQAGHELDSW